MGINIKAESWDNGNCWMKTRYDQGEAHRGFLKPVDREMSNLVF